MQRFTQYFLLASTLLASACATIDTKANGSWGSPYSGAQCSAHEFLSMPPSGPIGAAIAAVDIPLSAIADTLLLPVDLIMLEDERAVPCEGP